MHTLVKTSSWLFALGLVACGDDAAARCHDSSCSVGALTHSYYCEASQHDCVTLGSLSQGCLGSHTEQACDSCAGSFVRVGGDDAVDLYFDQDGKLAAVRRVGEGTASCEAWFGLDLSDCVARGERVEVGCDGNGGP